MYNIIAIPWVGPFSNVQLEKERSELEVVVDIMIISVWEAFHANQGKLKLARYRKDGA